MLPHGFLVLEAVGMATHGRAHRIRFRNSDHSYLAEAFQIFASVALCRLHRKSGEMKVWGSVNVHKVSDHQATSPDLRRFVAGS